MQGPISFREVLSRQRCEQRRDCWTAALQRLIFPNMFIITLHYLNYQQEKWGERGGEGKEGAAEAGNVQGDE